VLGYGEDGWKLTKLPIYRPNKQRHVEQMEHGWPGTSIYSYGCNGLGINPIPNWLKNIRHPNPSGFNVFFPFPPSPHHQTPKQEREEKTHILLSINVQTTVTDEGHQYTIK
jgi:hypothetical protein